MMVKSGLAFFIFEILLAPSELPANLPGQFSVPAAFFALGSSNSEGTNTYLTQECWFQDLRF